MQIPNTENQKPLAQMRVSLEKIYRLDRAGNANVERSWILENPSSEEIEMTDYVFYVNESINTLGNVKAFDSNGKLEYYEEFRGSDIEINVKPRIKKLGSYQKYNITLQYHFPSFVHKLGEMWFFSDLICGIDDPPSDSISSKMDVTIRVELPNLEKKFWQKCFHESFPNCNEATDKHALEWKCSLSPQQNYPIKLVYGIQTNAKLTSFITGIGTITIGAIIKTAFDIATRG
jgi:hypothetical protein